jgi:hypothetical protein
MPAGLQLSLDVDREQAVELVQLGEILLPETEDDLIYGHPLKMWATNTGDTVLRQIEVHLQGDGGTHVQLAVDEEGSPGTWASAGESIILDQTLEPQAEFSFWARGIYHASDAEGRLPFDIQFKALSIG